MAMLDINMKLAKCYIALLQTTEFLTAHTEWLPGAHLKHSVALVQYI